MEHRIRRVALLGATLLIAWAGWAKGGPRAPRSREAPGEVPASPSSGSAISADVQVELREDALVYMQGTVSFSGPIATEWRALVGALEQAASSRDELAERLGALLALKRLKLPAKVGPPSEHGDVTVPFEIPPTNPSYAGIVRRLPLRTGPAAMAGFLPEGFLSHGEQNSAPADDYRWQPPFRAQLRLHLIVPDGFTTHDRIADGEWRFGTSSLRQRVSTETNGHTIALSLDTGPERMSPAILQAARAAWRQYLAEPGPAPSYGCEVDTLREAGRLMEAAAKARALVARNPRSVYMRVLLATVLLRSGLVLPARREAQAAIALVPTSVYAQQVLADTYEYGSNGERFSGDFDRAALVRERRKAVQPGWDRPPLDLASALARDAGGNYLASDDDLVEIVRLANMAAEAGWKRQARPLLLLALLRAHRYSELEALAREVASPGDGPYLLAAIAMQKGPAEALRVLPTLGSEYGNTDNLLQQTAALLVNARLYEEAAPLLTETARRLPSTVREVTDRLAYRRYEALVTDLRKPDDLVREVKRACRDVAHFVEARGRLLGDTVFEGQLDERDRAAYRSTCGTPAGVYGRTPAMIDATLASVLAVSGDRSRGFQIEERAPSDARDGSPRKYYFVMPDPSGHLRLVASDMAEVGREAMRQLDQHRPEAAAHLVEGGVQMLGSILRRIKEAGSKDLSLEERVFRLKVLWPAGAPPHRDPEAVRTAAAALAGPRFRTLAVPVLERAFARVTGSVRDAVGEELMAEAQADRRWSTVVELAGKLSEEARATRVVHEFLLAALGKLGRADEVEAIAADWRRRWPDELLVERLLVQHDVDEGRLAPAIARLERLLIRPEAEGVDHNNLAWYLFVLGGDRARAIDAARKAVNGRRDLNRVNTLACLLADAGQVDEAIRLAHEQQAAATVERPALSFLLALVAEKMDEPEEARRQYQRAVAGRRPDQPERISDVSALARARLTRLPAPAH